VQQSPPALPDLGQPTRCPTSRARNRTRKPRTRAPSTPACFATTWRWSAPPPSASSAATPPLWRWFPFWAVWRSRPAPPGAAFDRARRIDGHERDDLAASSSGSPRATTTCSRCLFPYSLGFHQRPTDGQPIPSGIFTRTSTRRCCVRPRCASFLVGYEMLAMPQRDITPEAAAARLREVGRNPPLFERPAAPGGAGAHG